MGCAVGPEAKSELSREERKMQQQLELFKKMEAATQKDEAGGGGRGGKANASEKTAGQRVGAAKERKTADVDREEVSGASSDEEEGKQGRAPRKSCPSCRKVLSSAPPPLRTWCMGMHWSTLFVEQSVRASRSMCVVARARASRTLCAKPFSASCKAIARVGC